MSEKNLSTDQHSYIEYLEAENKKLSNLLITQQSLLKKLKTKFRINTPGNSINISIEKNGITVGEYSHQMYGEKLVSVSTTREYYHNRLKWGDTIIKNNEKEYFFHLDFCKLNDTRPKIMEIWSTIIHCVFDWSCDTQGSLILRIYAYNYDVTTQQIRGTLQSFTKPADLTKNDIEIFERTLSKFCNNNNIKSDLICPSSN